MLHIMLTKKARNANLILFESKQENKDCQLDIQEALENETVSNDATKTAKTE